jgi:hypothetical protein
MILPSGSAMSTEPAAPGAGSESRKPGRPKLGVPRRFRITTTIEPAKLALIREHARRVRKSLGQLADEYVSERFESGNESAE